jgi:hypothetical protein
MSSSTTTTTMEKGNAFANFDDEAVYNESKRHVLDPNTTNFVVEFGKEEAQIAYKVKADHISELLTAERAPGRPVRWM